MNTRSLLMLVLALLCAACAGENRVTYAARTAGYRDAIIETQMDREAAAALGCNGSLYRLRSYNSDGEPIHVKVCCDVSGCRTFM